MIFVLPVSDVDLHLAGPLAKHIERLGGVDNERAIVVSTWRASWDIAPILEPLQRCFGSLRYIRIGDEMEDGWPVSCSHLFVRTAEHLESAGDAWFFCEADHWPIRRGWFADLKQEYEAAGKPYMGVHNTAKFYNTKTLEFVDGEFPHLVGTAIYPKDFLSICSSIHSFDWRVPWDVAIGEEIMPDSHNTKLMAHRWGTKNWRLESDGLLHGDLTDKAIAFHAKPPLPVSFDCATLHGTKDLQLYNALNMSEFARSDA